MRDSSSGRGGQHENTADHRAAFRAEGEELRDAGSDEADDEERRAEGEGELPPGFVEAEERAQDRGEGSEEQAEKAARAKAQQGVEF